MLFFRAQSAKPCILFFDEFDSIAPRQVELLFFHMNFIVCFTFLNHCKPSLKGGYIGVTRSVRQLVGQPYWGVTDRVVLSYKEKNKSQI